MKYNVYEPDFMINVVKKSGEPLEDKCPQGSRFTAEDVCSILEKVYQKKYQEPSGYNTYSGTATGLIGFCNYLLAKNFGYYKGKDKPHDEIDTRESTAIHFLVSLINFASRNCPTFWLSDSLYEMMSRTDVDTDITTNDLGLPFDNFVILFPKRAKLERLYVCKDYENDLIQIGNIDFKKEFYYSLIRPNQKISETITGNEECDAISRAFVYSVLIMNSLPELVSGSKVLKRIKNKRLGKIRLWSPNFIGKNVAIHTDGEGGQGVCSHWRRGHFRRQSHGQNRSLKKIIWIKPMLINGKEAV